MNERIKELAEQAGFETDRGPLIGPSPYIRVGGLCVGVPLEKFAKLIVRECLIIADEQKKQVEEMEVYNLQDEVWNRARIQQSEHIVDEIKQHFGVEE